MQRKPKAKRRRSRTRIVDDLTTDAIRHVAEAWSRAESDGAPTDGSDWTPIDRWRLSTEMVPSRDLARYVEDLTHVLFLDLAELEGA